MGQPVILNVYDLSEQNSYLYWCGLGVYHSGVEVYGVEFAYGGHDFNSSGVFATKARQAPGEVQFRSSIIIGETDMSREAVQQLVRRMGSFYKGNKYHLLQRNCNHFSSDLCYQLTRKRPPFWVNRLAGVAIMLHCLLPTGWVPALETPTVIPVEGEDGGNTHNHNTIHRRNSVRSSQQYPSHLSVGSPPAPEQQTLLTQSMRSDDAEAPVDNRIQLRI